MLVKYCPSPWNSTAVATPAILTLSKLVCPSISTSPLISRAVKVDIPIWELTVPVILPTTLPVILPILSP